MSAIIKKIKNYIIHNSIFCLIILAVLIYTILLSTICILKYNAFSYYDFDFALHIQKYWNTLHGDTSIPMFGGTKIWGNALEVITFPLSLIYALLFLSPKGLLILQSFILGLGAIPIFLIAKREIPESWGASFAISYLLYPALWFVNLFEYHDMVFSTLTLLFAFYFFKREKFSAFIIFIILSIMFRADIALIILMFGIYAFLDKKSIKWSISPLVISILWILIGVFIIIPAFRTEVRYDAFYAHLGRSFPEIVKNMILHPSILINSLFKKQNAIFLFHMLFPVGFVSLLGLKELMICVLSLIQHLVSLRWSEHSIYFHYTATITPFIYISAIYGLSRLQNLRINKRILSMCILALPLIANFWYGPLSNIEGLLSQLQRDNLDEQREILLSKIPKEAPVISTFEFMPRLANRRYLYSFHYVYFGKIPPYNTSYKTPANIEYALIDFTDKLMTGSFKDMDSDKRTRDFLQEDNWGLIESINNIALFKKGHQSNISLYEIKSAKQDKKEFIINANNFMQLKDYALKISQKNNDKVLAMTFNWGCLKKIEDDIAMAFLIFDKANKLVYVNFRPICYGVYPTRRWLAGETIADNYNLLLPDYINTGEYYIKMLLFSVVNGNTLPLSKNNINVTLEGQERLLLDKIKL